MNMQPQVLNPLGMTTTKRPIAYSESGAWWDLSAVPECVEIRGYIPAGAHLSDADITRMVKDYLQTEARN